MWSNSAFVRCALCVVRCALCVVRCAKRVEESGIEYKGWGGMLFKLGIFIEEMVRRETIGV
jgi:hypothetical protein